MSKKKDKTKKNGITVLIGSDCFGSCYSVDHKFKYS